MMWGRGYGMEVRKGPNKGVWREPRCASGLNRRECNPKKQAQGVPGRRAGSWVACIEESGMGPMGGWPRRMMQELPRVGGGHSEAAVPWWGGLRESKSPHGRRSACPRGKGGLINRG